MKGETYLPAFLGCVSSLAVLLLSAKKEKEEKKDFRDVTKYLGQRCVETNLLYNCESANPLFMRW